jgi:hypothetical protein
MIYTVTSTSLVNYGGGACAVCTCTGYDDLPKSGGVYGGGTCKCDHSAASKLLYSLYGLWHFLINLQVTGTHKLLRNECSFHS